MLRYIWNQSNKALFLWATGSLNHCGILRKHADNLHLCTVLQIMIRHEILQKSIKPQLNLLGSAKYNIELFNCFP